MKSYLRYSKFLISSLGKKWSIYLTSGLYILMLLVFLYVFPFIFHKSLLDMFKLKTVLIVFLLFGAIAAATLGTEIFKGGFDSGTELLISAKPITRTQNIWTKLAIFVIYSLLISLLTAILVSFTGFLPSNQYNSIGGIVAGYFCGTLISYFLWGGLAILIAAFSKRLVAIISVAFINAAILVLAIVCSLILTTPGQNFVEKQQLTLNSLCLFNNKESKNSNKEDNINYQWYTIASIKNQNQVKPILNNTNPYFMYEKWREANKKSNLNILQKINFDYQLASLFCLTNPDVYLHKGVNSSIDWFTDGFNNKISYWTLNIKKNKNPQDLPINKPKKYVGIYPNKESQFIMSSRENVVLTNPFLKLTNHDYEHFYGKSYFKKYSGSSTLSKYITNNSFEVPTLNYSIGKENWTLHSFRSNEEFLKYFYSKEFIKTNKSFIEKVKYQPKFNNDLRKDLNYSSLYQSIIMSYLVKKNNLDILHKNKTNISKVLSEYTKMFDKFQYWTYIGLENLDKNPELLKELGSDGIASMLDVLNLPINEYKDQTLNINNKIVTFVGSPAQLIYCLDPQKLNEIKNKDTDTNKVIDSLIHNYWYETQNQLSLVPTNYLSTASYVTLGSVYNNVALVLCWLGFSVLILFVGASMYIRKDIM